MGSFCVECLNEHWFLSLADTMQQIEAWRIDYNTVRPHSALGNQTQQFASVMEDACRRRRQLALTEKTKT